MKFLKIVAFSVFSLLAVTGCKKEEVKEEKGFSTHLPNFGNVDVNSVFSKEDSQLDNEAYVQSYLNQYYDHVWEKGNLWGGILVAKGDKILLEKYRGYAQDGETSPIDANTPMHVASISKSLTAMVVLKLVDAKQINLDDSLVKYFPKFPYPKVTVRTLLNQRSGLPKYEYFIEKISPEPQVLSKKYITNQDILDMLIQYKPDLARDTDTGFMYCNTNYALLALIVEKVTKTSFPDAMQQMVFKPLQMDHSYIFQEKDTLTAAKSFYASGPKVHPYDRLDLVYGDKNVFTTPRDLFTFSKAMYSKDFMSKQLLDQAFLPYSNEKKGVNNYGFGFRMKNYDQGDQLTYHNGWWHGSNTVFGHLLKSKTTIIAIGNKYSTRVYTALSLASLFGDYPFEHDKLMKTVGNGDSVNSNSTNDISIELNGE